MKRENDTGWKWRQLFKWIGATVLVLVATGAAAGGWAFYLQQTGNVHAVEAGRVYRSNTLGAAQLEAVINTDNIRTILNLRGGKATDSWYAREREIASRHGINYVDVPMSDDRVPDPATLDRLIEVLRTAQQPLLIHCKAGADRTGLASALYQYLVEGKDPSVASGQLSFFYGHFPWLGSKTSAMDSAFWQVVSSATNH